jgi:hypothetical protein
MKYSPNYIQNLDQKILIDGQEDFVVALLLAARLV